MKKLLFLLMFVCTGFPVLAQSDLETSSLIVSLKRGVVSRSLAEQQELKNFGAEAADALNQQFGAQYIRPIRTGANSEKLLFTIEFSGKQDSKTLIEAYLKTGLFEYAEPNYEATSGGVQATIPNDMHFGNQWGLKNNGNFLLSPSIAGADVDMTLAWDVQKGDPNQILCIIDSGCKLDHPEFAGRIWQNTAEIPNNNFDDDGNGYVDDVRGWDFINQDNGPWDDHGHGTNVAGIAAATGNNGFGYAGVNWRCKVMILKVLNHQNNGSYAGMAGAIYYAVNKGAKVINMSIGGTSASQTLKDAVDYAHNQGVVFVACMMNTNSATPYYPAAYNTVIAVGATNPNDTRSSPFFWSAGSGSSYGSHISVVAPGNYIYGLNYQSDTDFNTYWGGTSQAAPLVAGIASLLLAQNPGLTPAKVKQIIETTAEDRVGSPLEDVTGWDQYYGHGRVNANNALQLVLGKPKEIAAAPDFRLFPNPTTGELFISAGPGINSDAELTVTNALGQVILKKKLQLPEEKVMLPSPGLYLVTTTSRQKQKTQKIVVN